MVQIIEENRRPDNSQVFFDAISQFGQGYIQKKGQMQSMQAENEAAKKLGIDLTGITDPKMRQQAIVETLKGQHALNRSLESEKLKGQIQSENFPKKFASQYGEKYKAQLDMLKQLGLDQPYQEGNFQENQPGFPTGSPMEDSDDISNDTQASPRETTTQQKKKYPPLIPQRKIDAMGLINPQEASRMQRYNDGIRDQMRHNEELEYRKSKENPEARREQELSKQQASADVKYNQELQSGAKQHELKKQTLDRLEALNRKGATGKPYEKLLEKFGLVALTSEGRREFSAEVKNLITDIRSILGGQFSNFEFQTILNAYPSADFNKEANSAIIKNLKEFQDIKSKEVQFANQLKKENGGKIPVDFQTKVNEKVQEYTQRKLPEIKRNTQEIMNSQYGIPKGHTLLLDPQGEPLSVPNDQIDMLIEQGAMYP